MWRIADDWTDHGLEAGAHVNVGLIGTGNIARTHARAAHAAGLTVAAVCGRSRAAALDICALHGGEPYTDLDACLGHPALDFVVIGTPSGLHAEHAMAAVARRLPVLVEKPLDITVARADALLAAADDAGVAVGVCYQDRFAPDLCAVKTAIDRGDLGRLLLVDARVPWYRPPSYYASSAWRGTWDFDGGGALMNQGIHTVDLLLWLCGDAGRVCARTAALRHRIEVEDTAAAVIDFVSGAIGTLSVTTAAYPGYARRLVIAGTAGTVTIERDALVAADFEGGLPPGLAVRPPMADDGRSASAVVADVSGHRALFEDMARAVRDGGTPRCDGRDGRRSVALVRAIYDASASGCPVELAPA